MARHEHVTGAVQDLLARFNTTYTAGGGRGSARGQPVCKCVETILVVLVSSLRWRSTTRAGPPLHRSRAARSVCFRRVGACYLPDLSQLVHIHCHSTHRWQHCARNCTTTTRQPRGRTVTRSPSSLGPRAHRHTRRALALGGPSGGHHVDGALAFVPLHLATATGCCGAGRCVHQAVGSLAARPLHRSLAARRSTEGCPRGEALRASERAAPSMRDDDVSGRVHPRACVHRGRCPTCCRGLCKIRTHNGSQRHTRCVRQQHAAWRGGNLWQRRGASRDDGALLRAP